MDKVELTNWRQREVQMLGAAISRRDWHDLESAYNQLRDKMDAALIRPATTIEALQAQVAAKDAEIAKLREAGSEIITHMFSTYKARNGREVGVQGDDGEKVWLVHSDYIFALQAALG